MGEKRKREREEEKKNKNMNYLVYPIHFIVCLTILFYFKRKKYNRFFVVFFFCLFANVMSVYLQCYSLQQLFSVQSFCINTNDEVYWLCLALTMFAKCYTFSIHFTSIFLWIVNVKATNTSEKSDASKTPTSVLTKSERLMK